MSNPTDNDLRHFIYSGLAERTARALNLGHTDFLPDGFEEWDEQGNEIVRNNRGNVIRRAVRAVRDLMELPSDDEEDALQDYEWNNMDTETIEEAVRKANKAAKDEKVKKAKEVYLARQMAVEEQLEEALDADEPLEDNNN